MEKNKQVLDTLELMQDLSCISDNWLLKGIKNNYSPDADSVVNGYLRYGGCEARDKLQKIMNIVLKKGQYLAILEKQ